MLSFEEINFFVKGIADESISEGQVTSFAMAVYFSGMNVAELVAHTESKSHSGDVIGWIGENLFISSCYRETQHGWNW